MCLSLDDIVIDTNVFLHANDPNQDCFGAAIFMLKSILDGETRLCVDAHFDLSTIANTSQIGWEYREKLPLTPGSFPFYFLSTILQDERLRELPKFLDQRTKRIILRRIRNAKDRVFVGVACSATEGILISHDFQDFSRSNRGFFAQRLQVKILCSVELCKRSFSTCEACSK